MLSILDLLFENVTYQSKHMGTNVLLKHRLARLYCFTQTFVIISPEIFISRFIIHTIIYHQVFFQWKILFLSRTHCQTYKDSLLFGWLLCGRWMWQRPPDVLVVTYLERRRCGDWWTLNVNFSSLTITQLFRSQGRIAPTCVCTCLDLIGQCHIKYQPAPLLPYACL